jgi:hypothetical protein
VTTLPIDTEEQTQEIIRYYCIRWQIEVYFRTCLVSSICGRTLVREVSQVDDTKQLGSFQTV